MSLLANTEKLNYSSFLEYKAERKRDRPFETQCREVNDVHVGCDKQTCRSFIPIEKVLLNCEVRRICLCLPESSGSEAHGTTHICWVPQDIEREPNEKTNE